MAEIVFAVVALGGELFDHDADGGGITLDPSTEQHRQQDAVTPVAR